MDAGSNKDVIHAIALRTVRYGDSQAILTAYTRQRGRVSIAIPNGATPGARRLRALLAPFSPFSAVIPGGQRNRQIVRVTDVVPLGTYPQTRTSPARMMQATLVAEALGALLRETAPDPLLFDYLISMVATLETIPTGTGLNNFHLDFFVRLTRFLGIMPDEATWRRGYVFDMQQSVFLPTPPAHTHWLDPKASRLAAAILRQPDILCRLPLTHAQRAATLDVILEYYGMHYQRLDNLSSLDIFRAF